MPTKRELGLAPEALVANVQIGAARSREALEFPSLSSSEPDQWVLYGRASDQGAVAAKALPDRARGAASESAERQRSKVRPVKRSEVVAGSANQAPSNVAVLTDLTGRQHAIATPSPGPI